MCKSVAEDIRHAFRIGMESLYANNNNLVLVGDKTPLGLGYGIIAGKENSDLMFKINKALMAMETDGTYLTIYNIYFGDMKY